MECNDSYNQHKYYKIYNIDEFFVITTLIRGRVQVSRKDKIVSKTGKKDSR
jgi:hypothetical protein